MKDKQSSWLSKQLDSQETLFRPISPDAYTRFGIDPQDVPMGTFAAKDHPSFLPSRFGGNAYGLGLMEQSGLSRSDTDFLESLNYDDSEDLARNARRLNAIYQKLGLLIRFGTTGERYFLIPINLVAHSRQETKTKADEVEDLVVRHTLETRRECLDIGLMAAEHDFIAHELTARLSTHRIFLFDSIEEIRSWRMPLDIMVAPRDLYEYLLEQRLPKGWRQAANRRRLHHYAMHVAGKIYDLLEPGGKFIMLAHYPFPCEDFQCRVGFKSDEELKSFLFFSRIFKTRERYVGNGNGLTVWYSDLYYYMRRFSYPELHVKRLLGDPNAADLRVDEINNLPHLNIRLPRPYARNLEKQWKCNFEIYFETVCLKRKSPEFYREYWNERIEADAPLPENLLLCVGRIRRPQVTLPRLEEEVRASGMMGCSLPLVAEYRNSFRYTLDVLRNVVRIRDREFPKLSELELTRLGNPFLTRNENFTAIQSLVSQVSKLEKIHEMLNPDHVEGYTTPILENISKLSLHGFTAAQLREILLIVVGHTTMSRIVFGKLPAKTLKPITDRAKEGSYQEIVVLLRIFRLMSMAQIAAALGEGFTAGQAKELFMLYDDAIQVATEPGLDWDKLIDQRISTLGGVQNKAIREMMKFFNFFDFINSWQEFTQKGCVQKEVLCDYDARKVSQLEATLELAETATQFKQGFHAGHIFGQSYFFRQFLEKEFHGTGRLFPKLGSKAGFILIWIAVNAAEKRIINFNPILAQVLPDRYEQRLAKMREVLLRIPAEWLQPGLFNEIKETVAAGSPAFIFNSGIRLMGNPETRALDVSFVDVQENIRQIDALLTHFESQKLRGISLRNLQSMERLFAELASFHQYLQKESGASEWEALDPLETPQHIDREIGQIEERLKALFQTQIFIPEEVYDTISVLAANCPEMLRFILPEFHDFGNLIEKWPTRERVSLGVYVMRCLQKFQALITRDRNAFQDRNTFYQLAKHEFGPLAEEGIGATHAQIETLEHLVSHVQQRPSLYQALVIALLFQDIGKIDKYAEPCRAQCTHAEQSALVLEESRILEKYGLDPHVQRFAVRLIHRHGSIGHVIQGEEPATVLEHLTLENDDRLLDAFVIHAVVAAAAVQEGLMTSDLLGLFLAYRAAALQIIKSRSGWQSHLREVLEEKGEAVMEDLSLAPEQIRDFLSEPICGQDSESAAGVGDRDEPLRRGRLIAAFERLLRLMGASWIDFQDLQMHLLKMPTNFIYHKKRLESVGPASFEKQLHTAAGILETVLSYSAPTRSCLLYCLDHQGGAMRVYDFRPLTRFLDLEESLKLLFMAFQAYRHHFGSEEKGGLISFRPLTRIVDKRHIALRSVLEGVPMPPDSIDSTRDYSFSNTLGTLRFEARTCSGEPSIRIVFQDAVPMHSMMLTLSTLSDPRELSLQYHGFIEELRDLPFDTNDYEVMLREVFQTQQQKINDRILSTFQALLNKVQDFHELESIQDDIRMQQAEMRFSEEQRMLLKELLEHHRARVRDRYLDAIFQKINALESAEDLLAYWDEIKVELFSYRSYVGKEYESLIAEFLDQRVLRQS